MRRLAAGLLLVATMVLALPARAQPDGEDAPAAAPTIAFRPVVDAAIDGMIVPAYRQLDIAAAETAATVGRLCPAADAPALAAARGDFARLVEAWSRVEMFRFGPAREDNRFERLFFWPDQKGLGLRQIEEILRTEDATATEVASLRAKSVAVQGLLALEYVLFGEGSEALSAGAAESFRCRYGRAVAGAIAATARELHAGWSSEGGYAGLMRTAGDGNPVYRSHGEVIQDLIRAAREQLQIDRDLKLARPIGAKPEAANPRRAPFWRSNLTLAAIRANVDAVIALQDAAGLAAILPEDSKWIAGSLAFELAQVEKALAAVATSGAPFETAVREPASHQLLAYALIPLGSAIALLTDGYPNALGLITGFNSRDGD